METIEIIASVLALCGAFGGGVWVLARYLANVERRISGVETNLAGLSARVDGVSTRVDDTNTRIDGLAAEVRSINEHLRRG